MAMEENGEQIEAAVAFVDLVRFTALTDVHGDHVAADAAVAIEQSARRRVGPRVKFIKAAGDGVLLQATAAPVRDGLGAVAEGLEIGVLVVQHRHQQARPGADPRVEPLGTEVDGEVIEGVGLFESSSVGVGGFEDLEADAALVEQVAGGEPSGAGSDDHEVG